VTPEELKALISKYGDTDKLAQSGVTIAGTRYMYLSSTDRVVRAKKGTNGVHAIKTQQSKFHCSRIPCNVFVFIILLNKIPFLT
jgi:hypothetical protein